MEPPFLVSHPRPDTRGWQSGKSRSSGQVTEALRFDPPFCESGRITPALSTSQTSCQDQRRKFLWKGSVSCEASAGLIPASQSHPTSIWCQKLYGHQSDTMTARISKFPCLWRWWGGDASLPPRSPPVPLPPPTPAPQCPAPPPRTHLGVEILLQQLLELCVLPFQRTVFYQQLSPLGQEEALGRKS